MNTTNVVGGIVAIVIVLGLVGWASGWFGGGAPTGTAPQPSATEQQPAPEPPATPEAPATPEQPAPQPQ